MLTMGELRRDKGSGGKPLWISSQGRWRAQYTDASGHRRQVSSAIPGRKGERACAKARDAKLELVRSGLDVGEASQKLSDYLDRWLRAKKRELRPRSYQKYESTVRLYIVPRLGSVQIGKLRHARISAAYDELAGEGVPAPTIRYVHAVLHSALTAAVKRRTLATNPADHAGAPRESATEIRPFTPDETQRLLTGIQGDPLEVLVILALRTAMRLGELLGLRWSDVDGSTLHVQRELYRLGAEWHTDAPKSGKTRNIAITSDTADMLRAYRLERSEALLSIGHRVTNADLVFMTDAGQPFDGQHLTERRFQPLLRRLDLLGDPKHRFHDLRHTAATLMLAAGVHPKVVQEMLGHADVQITINRYSHVLPTMQVEAAAALEALTTRAVR